MKAMILAAGKGTRIRPLTNVMPKPMIPLIRKPILEAIIEHLKRHSFDEIYVNTSYLSRSIEDYFRDGERWGVALAFSYEGELQDGEFVDRPIGSAGGMRKIFDRCGFFDDTFAVLCGDALINVDLSEAVRLHRQRGAVASIITKEVPREEVSKYGVVVTHADGRVSRFQEKPKVAEAASNLANTGIYIFEPRIFDYIPAGVEFDIGSQLFPALIAAAEPVFAHSLPFEWVDIGNVKDFWEATRAILEGRVKGLSTPGREIRPGVFCGLGVKIAPDAELRGPIYVGAGTTIESKAQVTGPTCIGANCIIGSGARVSESILGDYTRVASLADLDKRIIVAGKYIEPNGDSLDLRDADIDWLVGDARAPAASDAVHPDLRSHMAEAANGEARQRL
jgi:mannose-1-phosphate guanylyltransferase